MKNKISTKIIASILLCSIIISAVIGITATNVATREIKEEAFNRIESIAESKGNEFSIQVEKSENAVKEYAQIISDGVDTSKLSSGEYIDSIEKKFGPFAKSVGISNNRIIGLYINFNPEITGGKAHDIAYYYDKNSKEADVFYDSYKADEYFEGNAELSWYYQAVKAKEGVWAKPYIDPKSDNTKMISYTMPVYKNDKLIGVAGIDISFEELQNMILDTKVYDTGNAFLLDKDFNFIVEKNVSSNENFNTMRDGAYKDAVDEIKNKKKSFVEINIQGEKTVLGYFTLENGDIVGVRVPTSEVLHSISSLKAVMLTVVVVGLILAGILGLYISRKISKPIEMATDSMKKLAKLDLSDGGEDFDSLLSNKDETGLMIESLIAQRYELLEIVKALRWNSYQIMEDTNTICDAEADTVHSISMITKVMEQLSEKACYQTEKVMNVSTKVDNITREIKDSIEDISKIEENSKIIEEIREKGRESLKQLSERFEANIKDVNITENTNDNAYNVIVEEAKNIIEVSNEVIDGIGKAASNAIKEIEGFAADLNKLNDDKGDMIGSLEEISQLTEEVTLSVENVTASIEEQESAMRSTAERTTELKNVSKALEDMVNKFKI